MGDLQNIKSGLQKKYNQFHMLSYNKTKINHYDKIYKIIQTLTFQFFKFLTVLKLNLLKIVNLNHKFFSRIHLKPINIRWIITGSHPYEKLCTA